MTRRSPASPRRAIETSGFSPSVPMESTWPPEISPSGAVVVWDVDRGALCVRDPGPVGGAARFSPDSRRIALAHEDGSLLVYDLKSGQCCRRWRGPAPAGDLAFRPDGGQIAVVYREDKPTCRILDADTGKQVRAISLPSAGSVAWSPDGTTLAIGGDDQESPSGTPQQAIAKRSWRGIPMAGLRTAFHPAGTMLASNGYEARLRLWDPVLGRQVLSVTDSQVLARFQPGRPDLRWAGNRAQPLASRSGHRVPDAGPCLEPSPELRAAVDPPRRPAPGRRDGPGRGALGPGTRHGARLPADRDGLAQHVRAVGRPAHQRLGRRPAMADSHRSDERRGSDRATPKFALAGNGLRDRRGPNGPGRRGG